MTPDILALADWLAAHEVTHVAMESTGVYWKPIWNLLEEQFDLLLVNARHVKAVPGRKTDVRDCEWLADLLRHGLLTGQLRPGPAAARAARVDPLPDEPGAGADGGGQPPAEDPGRRQHQAGLGRHRHPGQIGTGDPGRAGRGGDRRRGTGAARAGSLAREDPPAGAGAGRARRSRTSASWWPSSWPTSTSWTRRIARVSAEIAERLRPEEDAIARLDTIPGVGRAVAEALVAEIGTDLTRFPSCQAPGLLGRALSGQPRERRQAPQRQDAQGQSLAAGLPGPGRARGGAHQGHLPGGAVPTTGGPPRPGEGGRRRRPLHPDHRLPPADRGNGLPRPGRQLLRRARSSGGGTSPRAPAGRVGLHGVLDTSGLARGRSNLFSDQAA